MPALDIAPHFTEEEFRCPCGCETLNPNRSFLERLERARVRAGIPFKVTSGSRCPEHNEDVGGKNSSSHLADDTLESRAADVWTRASRQRFLIRKALIQVGFTRFGTGTDFIHVDDDPTKDKNVEWVY